MKIDFNKPSQVEGQPKQELGFHRNEAIEFPSNEPELFIKCHEAIKAQLSSEELNQGIEFIIE